MENTNNQYKNTVLIAVIILLVGASITLHQFKIPTIMPQLMSDLSMNANTAAWTMSIFTLIGVFLAIPTGGLVDKLSGKKVMGLAVVFAAIGSVMGGMASDPTLLLISRAIEGIGFVFVAVAAPIAIRENCNPAQLGRAMGFWGGYVALGQIVAFNLTGILYNAIGWNNIWFVYAAVTALLGVIAMFTLGSPDKSAQKVEVAQAQEKVGLGSVITNKNLLYACISFALFNLLVLATMGFLPVYLITSKIMSPVQASFLATVPMICCVFCAPIAGRFAENIGFKKIYLVALAAAGIGTVLCFQTSITAIWIGAFLWGILGFNAPAVLIGSIGQFVDPKEIGIAQGLCMALQNCGMFLGTALFIPILTSVGDSYTTTAMVMAIPAMIIAIITGALAKFR